MRSTKYLLIGAGLASSQAAKELRAHDPAGAITLVGAEPFVPYDRPPLSKEFVRGEKPRAELFFDGEESFRDQGIELVLGVAVETLDLPRKTAILSTGEAIAFDKALIATGGRPVTLGVARADLAGVSYLRTLEDSAAIAGEALPGKRAVLVGAGFIGMELAASLTQRGVQVSVVEAQPRVWARFADPTLASFFQRYCETKGIAFYPNETVAEIRGTGRLSSVVTQSGRELPSDLVVIGVGIVPNAELAARAGLAVDNGVVVNEHLQTSHPDVYAAGDVANYPDPVFGKRRRVEHWGHAEYSGQLAGQNMAGASQPYDFLTYVWSDIFDLHLEFAGDESEHDRVLLRGRPEDKAFTILYVKRDALVAYFAVNTGSKEFPALQRLIRNRTDLRGKEIELQDPAVPLKGLR